MTVFSSLNNLFSRFLIKACSAADVTLYANFKNTTAMLSEADIVLVVSVCLSVCPSAQKLQKY